MTLTLTQSAKQAIQRVLSDSAIDGAVAVIYWSQPMFEEQYQRDESGAVQVEFKQIRVGTWRVGVYPSDKVPAGSKLCFDGVELILETGPEGETLDGKTIDYVGGRLIIV